MSYCSHVYEYSNPGPCNKCGYETHDPNWKEVYRLYLEYRQRVGYFYNTSQWWSI